jgi:hypothetical protein
MPSIFLSYRRRDAAAATGRLADGLAERFGRDQLFLDLGDLVPGDDFARALDHALRAAAVVLVMIGPDWLDARLPDGTRRLDDPGDFVRREIAAALESGVPVIPVLVEGARMPPGTALPDAIAALADRQACELSESRWAFDVERLLKLLEDRHGLEARRVATADPRVARAGLADALRAFPGDLFRLLVTPKRQLARRTQGAPSDATRAVVFFVLASLLGDVLMLLFWPSGPAPILLIAGQAIVGTLLLVLTPLMCAAWRIAGAPADYRRIGIVLAYQIAVLGLGFKLVGTIVLAALTLHDPEILSRLLESFRAHGVSDAFTEAIALATGPRWQIAAHVLRVVQVGIVAWLVASWGAYRELLGLGRLRSLAAFGLFVVLVVGPILLLRAPG